MHTFPLSRYMQHIRGGDWSAVADLMVESSGKVAQCGAQFVVCPDNTIHQAFDRVRNRSVIPWLHIAEAVRDEAWRHGYSHLGLLGTRYLMEGPVYPGVLEGSGVRCDVPKESDRAEVDRIIFGELVSGLFTEGSRLFLNEVVARLAARGCDAVVLGCTEIPLIVDPEDCPLPVLDSTRILARAAVVHALT